MQVASFNRAPHVHSTMEEISWYCKKGRIKNARIGKKMQAEQNLPHLRVRQGQHIALVCLTHLHSIGTASIPPPSSQDLASISPLTPSSTAAAPGVRNPLFTSMQHEVQEQRQQQQQRGLDLSSTVPVPVLIKRIRPHKGHQAITRKAHIQFPRPTSPFASPPSSPNQSPPDSPFCTTPVFTPQASSLIIPAQEDVPAARGAAATGAAAALSRPEVPPPAAAAAPPPPSSTVNVSTDQEEPRRGARQPRGLQDSQMPAIPKQEAGAGVPVPRPMAPEPPLSPPL